MECVTFWNMCWTSPKYSPEKIWAHKNWNDNHLHGLQLLVKQNIFLSNPMAKNRCGSEVAAMRPHTLVTLILDIANGLGA